MYREIVGGAVDVICIKCCCGFGKRQSSMEVTGLREGSNVSGCLLTVILILDYVLDAYISRLCVTPAHGKESSVQQHALWRWFMLLARSEGTSFTPGDSAGHAW
jgi:hypothetical protein